MEQEHSSTVSKSRILIEVLYGQRGDDTIPGMKKPKPRQSIGVTEVMEIRVTPQEKAAYRKAAELNGLSLSVWVRLTLNNKVRK